MSGAAVCPGSEHAWPASPRSAADCAAVLGRRGAKTQTKALTNAEIELSRSERLTAGVYLYEFTMQFHPRF